MSPCTSITSSTEVGETRRIWVAAPDYLATAGVPQGPDAEKLVVAMEQGVMHGPGFALEIVHGLKGRAASGQGLGLALYHRRGLTRGPGEQQDKRGFKLVHHGTRRRNGGDLGLIIGPKIHQIDAAKGRRILILTSAPQTQILALNIEGEACNLIGGEGPVIIGQHRLDHGDHQS